MIAENGWFAARPSGTEDVYKIYAESFRSEDHLRQIQQEAQGDTLAYSRRTKKGVAARDLLSCGPSSFLPAGGMPCMATD